MSFEPMQNLPAQAAKSSEFEASESKGFRTYRQILEKKILAGDAAGDASKRCKKKVEVIEEEGIVKRIRIRCSCGEITELDCDYGEIH